MNHCTDVTIGLDVGTGGARALAVDFEGRLVGEGRASYRAGATTVSGPRVEQDPMAWRDATQRALCQLTDRLPATRRIAGLGVDATSGTFLLVDPNHRPVTPGVMYNDQRAVAQTPAVADTLAPVLDRYGIHIAPTFALPKIVHFITESPDVWRQCCRVVHQTDWIVGMLCDRYDVTDISTALKTGADPGRLAWPDEIGRLGIPLERLPRIVRPGTPIGTITAGAAAVTGLPVGVPVVAGCTDGTAGCLASGAAKLGDLNVTLGTTLVFKAVASQPLADPDGVIYNHRHPAGGYLPGAASSTGAEWVERYMTGIDLNELARRAARLIPTGDIVYPLVKTGERFPFCRADAAGFGLEQIADPARRFAAGLEAVAFLERLGIERIEQLGLPLGSTIYATGGATGADLWLRIRATVNRRVYAVPRYPECAVGAALLAALPHFGSFSAAAGSIVRAGREIEPESRLLPAYDEMYHRFRQTLADRGYITRRKDVT